MPLACSYASALHVTEILQPASLQKLLASVALTIGLHGERKTSFCMDHDVSRSQHTKASMTTNEMHMNIGLRQELRLDSLHAIYENELCTFETFDTKRNFFSTIMCGIKVCWWITHWATSPWIWMIFRTVIFAVSCHFHPLMRDFPESWLNTKKHREQWFISEQLSFA